MLLDPLLQILTMVFPTIQLDIHCESSSMALVEDQLNEIDIWRKMDIELRGTVGNDSV